MGIQQDSINIENSSLINEERKESIVILARSDRKLAQESSEKFYSIMAHIGTSYLGDDIRDIADVNLAKEVIWKFVEEVETLNERNLRRHTSMEDI